MRLATRLCIGVMAGTVAMAGIALTQEKAAEEKPAPAPALAIGEPAPMTDVKMKNVDGKEIAIADVAGKKGTLVIFTCNACPWAQAWEKRIVAIGNRYPKRGIGVIAINPNDPDKVADDAYAPMQKRAKQRGMKFPYVVDATSDLARAFGATRTPEVFLFDAEGRLVYHGAVDDNAKEEAKVSARYLEDALEAVIAGRDVAQTETKALGCTIKFRPRA